MTIVCPKCGSAKTDILATKPPTGFPQVILVRCNHCHHTWERWKPIDDSPTPEWR